MHKTSNTISIYIRNHQYKDGHGYRITTYGESTTRYPSCCGPMLLSDTVDYRNLTQTSPEDCIRAARDELEKLRMTLVREEECSAYKEEVQTVCPCDKSCVDELKANRSKRNRLVTCGMAVLTTIGIILVFKKKRNGNLW